MGTYTTNYQMYMPTIGEQGWGELVNGNFTTIDMTMKGLNARLTTVESGEFETVKTNVLYLPFSTTYVLELINSNNKSFSFNIANWASNTVTNTFTVSDMVAYLSDVIRPSDETSIFNVTITLSGSRSNYDTTGSINVSVNDVEVHASGEKLISANSSTPYSYTVSSLKLSDKITVTTYARQHDSMTGGTQTVSTTLSISPMGI